MTVTTTSGSSSAVESARLRVVVPTPPPPVEGLVELSKAQREVIAQMVPQAEDAGTALTGPDGLLKALTARIVGAALGEELNEYLGYDGDHRQRGHHPDRGVQGPRWDLRAAVGQETSTPLVGHGADGPQPVHERG